MSEFLASFAWPWVLGLLSLLPVLTLLTWRADHWRRRALAQLSSGRQVHQLEEERQRGRFLHRLTLHLGLALLILAAAGPRWGRDWSVATTSGRDLMLVLDVSRSMTAEQPARIDLARRAIEDLLAIVRQRGGHRLGLVLFAGRARLVCPLTQDYDHLAEVLQQIDELRLEPELGPGPREASGTRIGLGLVEALRAGDPARADVLDVLLLSDGDDPSGDLEWELAVPGAKSLGVPISVVGLGDPVVESLVPGVKDADGREVRSRLYEDSLRRIAAETGGAYIAAHRLAIPLGRLYLDSIATLPRRESVDRLPSPQARYALFLFPALILLGISLGRRD